MSGFAGLFLGRKLKLETFGLAKLYQNLRGECADHVVGLGVFTVNFCDKLYLLTVTQKIMNPVVHFEFPGEDMDRMKKFYETAFGWQTNQLGKEMGNYVVVTTTETDENQMIKKPGAINGGFYKRTTDPLSHSPSVVISVGDIREAMRKVEEAGGKVVGGGTKVGEPDEIPGVGLFISIIDTEGNRVSLLQPSKM